MVETPTQQQLHPARRANKQKRKIKKKNLIFIYKFNRVASQFQIQI